MLLLQASLILPNEDAERKPYLHNLTFNSCNDVLQVRHSSHATLACLLWQLNVSFVEAHRYRT